MGKGVKLPEFVRNLGLIRTIPVFIASDRLWDRKRPNFRKNFFSPPVNSPLP